MRSRSVVSDYVTLCTIACQASLSMRFCRQEYWGGLPCPPPEELPYPGIKPKSSALASGFFTSCCKNYHTLGDLKQQKFILSQFQRLEVWKQGVCRAMLSLEVLGTIYSLPLPASGGCQIFLVYVWISLIIKTSIFKYSPRCLSDESPS